MIAPSPVSLESVQLEEAASILIRSFADDPGLHFVLPDSHDRDRLSPALAMAVVRYALRCGSPLATPGPVRGVALWFAPGDAAPTRVDLEETGIAGIPELIGPDSWSRFERLLGHLDALHPVLAPDPHWFLAMLGVDPAFQRQGIGQALMEPVFDQADRDGVACYLEAPTESNARYYERRGFQVVMETDIPESDVHIWLMRRDPHSPS